MSDRAFIILIFILWFVLPLLPAFILYKFLPGNKAVVTGPFKGLKLDLAGAFAGYFLLFLGSYLLVDKLLFGEKERYEVWTVKGTVQDDRGRAIDRSRNKPSITLLPSLEINNGVFDFPVSVRVKDGFYDFPVINISALTADNTQVLFIGDDLNDFLDLDIDRAEAKNDGNWIYNFNRHTIKYRKPLKLTKDQFTEDTTVRITRRDSTSFDIDSSGH